MKKDIQPLETLLFSTIVPEEESEILHLRMSSKVGESANAPTVLVIPGIEGFITNVKPLCEKLAAHIIGLQYNYSDAVDTILDMAKMKLPVSLIFYLKTYVFTFFHYSTIFSEFNNLIRFQIFLNKFNFFPDSRNLLIQKRTLQHNSILLRSS